MNREKNKTKHKFLPDDEIIDLYWNRNESAIAETDKKYRNFLYTVAYNILNDRMDCEECLNDTYLGTWNSIPPTKPSVFQAFLTKIMRNRAITRYKKKSSLKRIPSEMTVSLDEFSNCLPEAPSAEEEFFTTRIGQIISDYLRSLSERSAFIFICRYYCSDKISDIADMLYVSERTVFRELTDMRDELKKMLEKEDLWHE